MKKIQNSLLGIFSILALTVYFIQPKPVLPVVAPAVNNNVMLYFLDEEYDVLLEPISVVCSDTKDCILKSYLKLASKPYQVLPENTLIQDLLLEEGSLKVYFTPSVLSLKQQKQKEALMWYFLQFDDVKRVQLYVDDVEWKINVQYDRERVFSNDFRLFTGDLYFSMPTVLFAYKVVNQSLYECVETVRIPRTEQVEMIAKWLLSLQAESLFQLETIEMEKKLAKVSLRGAVTLEKQQTINQWLVPFVHSLLVLPEVDEVSCYHEGILLLRMHQKSMYHSTIGE